MLLLRNSQFCFWSATPLPRFSDSYSSMKVINHFLYAHPHDSLYFQILSVKSLSPVLFTKMCIMCKLLTLFTPKHQVNFDFGRDHDLMATDSRISEVTVRKCTFDIRCLIHISTRAHPWLFHIHHLDFIAFSFSSLSIRICLILGAGRHSLIETG